MYTNDLLEIEKLLCKDLNSHIISGRTLLDRFRVINEDSRKTAAYLDHNYAPFYYYLGKYIKPKRVMEIGFDLGLLSSCFFYSCKTADSFLGFKETNENDYISLRIGKSNIKSKFKGECNFYTGSLYDEEMINLMSLAKFDLVIINAETLFDKHLEYLEYIWKNLNDDALIVSEYINRHQSAKDAIYSFADSKNRKPIKLNTRYGTAIMQR